MDSSISTLEPRVVDPDALSMLDEPSSESSVAREGERGVGIARLDALDDSSTVHPTSASSRGVGSGRGSLSSVAAQ
jgi:hypothetical protein